MAKYGFGLMFWNRFLGKKRQRRTRHRIIDRVLSVIAC